MIHVQVTHLKGSYVVRETEVGMVYELGVAGLREGRSEQPHLL